MSRALFVFSEQTPAAHSTVASSNPVAGAGSYFPAGVAGPLSDYEAVDVILDAPANTTGDTLDVYVQTSPDEGQNWYDAIHFPTIASGAAASSYAAPLSTATATSAPTQVGRNLSPALAAGAVVNGAFSDRMRLVMAAGANASSSITIAVRILAQRKERTR